MLFPDLELARRLELHEAWSSAEHARVQAALYPQTGAAWLAIRGGCAVYCGRRSPLSQVYGLGLAGPAEASDLDVLQGFYWERGLHPRVALCPLADDSLLHLLSERSYVTRDFMNVHARPITDADMGPPAAQDLQIRVASVEETRAWFERTGAGGDWAEPGGVAFMTIRCALKAGSQLFLAWRDDQPIGGGGLEMHDGLASLIADDTLAAHRGQGVQSALLGARLTAAAEAGCALAMVHTRPGSGSERNMLRAGFQLAYTRVSLVRWLSPAEPGMSVV